MIRLRLCDNVSHMLGKNHATLAATGWLALATPIAAATNTSFTTSELAVGAIVCAGAGVLPDIDHPDSRVSKSLGPVTGLASWIVSNLAGGHRQRTHTLWFVALAALGTAVAVTNPVASGVIAGLCVALAVSLVGPSLGFRVRTWHSLIAGIGVGYLVSSVVLPGTWLVWAVAGGCAAHLVGDALTPQGVPIFWPAKTRIRVPLFRTGGAIEKVVGVGLLFTTIYLSWTTFGAVA